MGNGAGSPRVANANLGQGIHATCFGTYLKEHADPLGVEVLIRRKDDYTGDWETGFAREMTTFFLRSFRTARYRSPNGGRRIPYPDSGPRRLPGFSTGWVWNPACNEVFMMLRSLLTDFGSAFRSLRRNPGLALAAVLVLSLGLGANLTIFSFFNAALLKPLPGIRGEDSLVLIGRSNRAGQFLNLSYPDFADLRRDLKSFSHVAARQPVAVSVAAGGQTERVRGEAVSSNYFEALRTRIVLGRGFQPNEDAVLGEGAVVVISHRYWQRRFQGADSVPGQQIILNRAPFTIIGVAEPGFRGNYLPAPADLFFPVSMYSGVELASRDATWLSVFGRLAPGYPSGRANVELATVAVPMRLKHAADFKDMTFRTARFNSVDEDLGSGDASAMTAVLGVLTLLSLFLVCANVANLLLVRAAGRWREISIRLALGAGRLGIIRLFLAEGMILALVAAAAGTIAGVWCSELLAAMIPTEDGIGRIELQAGVDSNLLIAALVLALLATLAFAGPAAWAASRTSIQTGLKPGETGAGGSAGRTRLRTVFAAVQVALCLTLLVCAGLVGRSMMLLARSDHGVELDRVAIGSIDLEAGKYTQPQGRAFLRELQERVRALPGVESVAVARIVPFAGGGMSLFGIWGGSRSKEARLHVNTNVQSPGFFDTIGMPLLYGRDFGPLDNEAARPAVIINEALARRMFPGVNAVGQIIFADARETPSFEVIGVARDGLSPNPQDGKVPAIHFSLNQVGQNLKQTIFVRTAGPPSVQLAPMRQVVASMDPNVPVFDQGTLRAAFEGSFFTVKLAGTIATFTGLLAMIVSTIGLYGLMAFTVARRTREIGVRLALGASQTRVLGSALAGGIRSTGIGLAAGLALSLTVTRVLRNVLFGVDPVEPAVIAAAAVFVLAAALTACYLPARRASRVDPASALRYE